MNGSHLFRTYRYYYLHARNALKGRTVRFIADVCIHHGHSVLQFSTPSSTATTRLAIISTNNVHRTIGDERLFLLRAIINVDVVYENVAARGGGSNASKCFALSRNIGPDFE